MGCWDTTLKMALRHISVAQTVLVSPLFLKKEGNRLAAEWFDFAHHKLLGETILL
jgi:hypothetical protein